MSSHKVSSKHVTRLGPPYLFRVFRLLAASQGQVDGFGPCCSSEGSAEDQALLSLSSLTAYWGAEVSGHVGDPRLKRETGSAHGVSVQMPPRVACESALVPETGQPHSGPCCSGVHLG